MANSQRKNSTKPDPSIDDEFADEFDEFAPPEVIDEKLAEEDTPISNPNALIAKQLARFDYENLEGETLKKYLRFVEGERDEDDGHVIKPGLRSDDKFDFQLYKVRTVKKKLYPRMKDSPLFVDKIILKEIKPVSTTRIRVRQAILLNAQYDTDHFVQGNGMYYLLKKV